MKLVSKASMKRKISSLATFFIINLLLIATSSTLRSSSWKRRKNRKDHISAPKKEFNKISFQLERRRLQEKNQDARYLVVFDVVGSVEMLGTIKHNVKSHFPASESWACIVFIHVDEEKIPESNADLKEISDYCSILRIPGLNWGHWLQIINPTFASGYERIAILLDDLFLPSTGRKKVSVPDLLNSMQKYNLSSISPSIAGGGNNFSIHPKIGPLARCLAEVEMIELYFQIFTREAWICFHSQLHHKDSESASKCYDKCYAQHCPGTNAVDYRMIGFHLETAWRLVPHDAKVNGINFQRFEKHDSFRPSNEKISCEENKCSSRFDIWQTRQEPLFCTESKEEQKEHTPKVMHTFTHAGFHDNQELLQIWIESWKNAGWDVRILTIEDAKMSKSYEYVQEALSSYSSHVTMETMKFLAMSTIPEGGWFSNPTIMPLYHSSEKELTLPNDGVMTIHEKRWLGLFSASQPEWERFVRYLVENKFQNPFAEINRMEPIQAPAFRFEDNVCGADYNELISGYICKITKDRYMAARFHDGDYLNVIRKKGFIEESNVPSYAKAWIQEFRDKCWKDIELAS